MPIPLAVAGIGLGLLDIDWHVQHHGDRFGRARWIARFLASPRWAPTETVSWGMDDRVRVDVPSGGEPDLLDLTRLARRTDRG